MYLTFKPPVNIASTTLNNSEVVHYGSGTPAPPQFHFHEFVQKGPSSVIGGEY